MAIHIYTITITEGRKGLPKLSLSVPIYTEALLCCNADNTASWTGSCITSLLGLWMTSLAQVISSCMDDNGTANDALWADKLDVLVGDRTLSVALTISLEVS